MPIRNTFFATLIFLTLFAPSSCDHPHKFLTPKGFVSDFSNVLDAETQKTLAALCGELDQKTHAQIAIVTVQSLGGTPIESYARGLFHEWGIGNKNDNRGILILLATSEYQWRIETGRGMEKLLPDARVGEIGAKMNPSLRQGNFSEALLTVTREIATIIAQDRGVSLTGRTVSNPLLLRLANGAPFEPSFDLSSAVHKYGA